MSALAKLTTITSKVSFSIAFTTASAMPGAHLRLQVVGGDLGRLHQFTLFAGKRLLDAAVEEIGDVGILLRFGDAEIAHVEVRHYVGEDVGQRLRRQDDRQGELLVVLRHADVGQVFGNAVARDRHIEIVGGFEFTAVLLGEAAVAGESAGDLPGTIGAKIEVDARVAITNHADGLALLVNYKGHDELVGDISVVGLLDSLHRVFVAAAFADAVHHRVGGFFSRSHFLSRSMA